MMTYHNKTCVNMASLKISEGMTLFAVDQALAEAGLLHGSRNLTPGSPGHTYLGNSPKSHPEVITF